VVGYFSFDRHSPAWLIASSSFFDVA
jgi:hypothetical protein